MGHPFYDHHPARTTRLRQYLQIHRTINDSYRYWSSCRLLNDYFRLVDYLLTYLNGLFSSRSFSVAGRWSVIVEQSAV